MFNYLLDMGGMLFRGPAITVLVEALLARGGKGDFPEAQARIGQLQAARRRAGVRVARTADAAAPGSTGSGAR